MKKRLFAMFLSVVMLAAVFSGCGKTTESGQTDSDISSIVSSEEQTTNVDNSNDGVSSSENQTTNNNSSSVNSSIDYEKLKGTTVKVLMWRELTEQEEKTIASFEKKYSMKVKVDFADQGSYTTKIASMVATKDSPDVAIIPMSQSSQGCFPIGAASIYQPCEVSKQDLNDEFWDKAAMANYKLKGKPYAFIAYNNWYNSTAVLMYNADMFKADGITTPYDLWKAGNWNWDTLKSTAEALKKKGHKYGLVVNQVNNYMGSANTDFVTYDGSKFTSSITDTKTVKAWTFNSQMVAAGLQPVYGTDINAFKNGEAGMFSSNTWVFRKEGLLNSCKFEVMGVPFPSPAGEETVISVSSNLFAIPKGAKNAVAGGVFIRFFLDSANNGDFSQISINPKLEEVFNYFQGKNLKKHYMMSSGVIGYSNLASLKALYDELNSTTASQVTTVLQKNKSLVDNTVNSINSKLK